MKTAVINTQIRTEMARLISCLRNLSIFQEDRHLIEWKIVDNEETGEYYLFAYTLQSTIRPYVGTMQDDGTFVGGGWVLTLFGQCTPTLFFLREQAALMFQVIEDVFYGVPKPSCYIDIVEDAV